jgi:WhiB family redox-sensing transcriptional regulator
MSTEKIEFDWMEKAACKGHPRDWWFPEFPLRKEQITTMRRAIEICSGCSVKTDCLDHSLSWEQFGIWGGMTERHRATERRVRNVNLRAPSDIIGFPKRKR